MAYKHNFLDLSDVWIGLSGKDTRKQGIAIPDLWKKQKASSSAKAKSKLAVYSAGYREG